MLFFCFSPFPPLSLSLSLSLSHTHTHTHTHTHKQEVHHCSAWVQVSSLFDLIDARSRRMSPLHVLRGLKCRLYKLQTRLKSCFRSESCGSLRTCACVCACACVCVCVCVKVHGYGKRVGHQ